MHRLTHARLALFLALLGLTSCSLFDKPEPSPGYVAIRNARVELDSVTGFTSSVGIRNIWAYHAANLHSTVSVPNGETVVLPIIGLDRSDFVFEGGVFETGQSAFNIPYPFWKPLNFNVQLQGLDTFYVEPVFEYIEPKFYDLHMNEGFEGGSVNLVPFSTGLTQPDSTFVRLRNNSEVFQGIGMGYVNFGPDDRYFEAITAVPFQLVRGLDAYAEITYKGTMAFSIGLLYQNTSAGLGLADIISVSPSAEWNTIYVHLVSQVREIVNQGGPDTDFWLWLQQDGQGKDGYIAFDDIRVISEK